MKMAVNTFILRCAIAVILLFHSLPGMFDGGVNGFGGYLNAMGFAPFGLFIAWSIKLSHVLTAIGLLINRLVVLWCWLTIFILLMGIVMVHFKEGWYVVGGGTNGMEFNILLIAALVTILYPEGFSLKRKL